MIKYQLIESARVCSYLKLLHVDIPSCSFPFDTIFDGNSITLKFLHKFYH